MLANSSEKILLNQMGFYRYGPKVAVVISPKTWYFTIKSPDLRKNYYKGELLPQKYWDATGDSVKIADFTSFDECGDFVVYVEGIGASLPFTIKERDLLFELVKGLIKAFYYQRASTALQDKYAGQWSRKAGH
ncbi:MAG: hypothetical protein N2053_10080, partial [Chitinispirillaceae bacterium]|nr:hypothetical protein [Chitinispirillaceae bacterium]